MTYDRIVEQILKTVRELNRLHGYDPDNHDKPRITFGYIGNVEHGRDDRHWSVFLPHTNRPGSAHDRIGGFVTNDTHGAAACLAALTGALILARWQPLESHRPHHA